MSKINFNMRGNLIPSELIKCELDDFYMFFLHNFPESKTRKMILDSFTSFLDKFQKLFNTNIDAWIDGSFVTKKLDPKDIDVVFFIDYELLENEKSKLIQDFHQLVNNHIEYVDAYLVIKFDENHPNYALYKADYAEWYHLFSKTRPTRSGVRFSKGIIHLTQNTA